MVIETKFIDGQEVYYISHSKIEKEKIKLVETRTLKNKTYIKYMMESGFWKNEEELYSTKEELIEGV